MGGDGAGGGTTDRDRRLWLLGRPQLAGSGGGSDQDSEAAGWGGSGD
jgi:hypothetical protein